jgi:hypothetical protein
VFYRVKHLEEDLRKYTTIWDAIADVVLAGDRVGAMPLSDLLS